MQDFRYNWISAALLIMSGALTACADNHDEVINNEIQDNLKYNVTSLPDVSLSSWWKGFEDPRLNTIVEQALGQNLGIKQARELLLSVYSVNNAEGVRYLPQASAGLHPVQDAAAKNNYLHATTEMSWELSLYGQSEAAQKLGRANVLTAETQLRAAKVSVEAETVFNYLRYIYANEQLKLLDEQFKLQSDNVQLEQVRYKAHVSSHLDVITSEMTKDDFTRTSYDFSEIKEQSLQSLRLLTNNKALEINQWNEKLLFSDFEIKSIPNDLLRTRPDIRQEEANVLKAAAELGFARAALYPRFSLLGSMTYSYDVNGGAGNTANRPFGIAPVIDIPLWDWGKRKSESTAKEHQLHAALIAYRETIMSSLSEVQNAMVSLSYQEQRMNLVMSRLNRDNHTLQLTEQAERLGFASRYDINKIKIAHLNDKQLQLLTGLQRSMKIIDLYKSLGGASLTNARSE